MGESFMRKWVWRLCVALWVAISTPVVLSFLLVLILPMLNAHPLSYFERRDPTTCPGYSTQYDDKLLACIHRANEAQYEWMATKLPITLTLGSAPWWLFPFWGPLAIWVLVRVFQRVRKATRLISTKTAPPSP